jgi:hypothetical protein
MRTTNPNNKDMPSIDSDAKQTSMRIQKIQLNKFILIFLTSKDVLD